jgi:hypothetical protein
MQIHELGPCIAPYSSSGEELQVRATRAIERKGAENIKAIGVEGYRAG